MKHTSFQRTVDSTVPIMTTAEAKTHLRVDFADEDALIDTYVEASRKICEEFTNRGFITQTWRENPARFFNPIKLSMARVISVTTVKYFDTDDVQQTISNTDYQVDLLADVGSVHEGISFSWPSTSDRINPIEILYQVGYGAASTDVPENIIQAVKLMLSYFYENRSTVNVTMSLVQQIPVPDAVKVLLAPFRINQLA